MSEREKELLKAVRVALKYDSINLFTYNKAKMKLAKYRNETKKGIQS